MRKSEERREFLRMSKYEDLTIFDQIAKRRYELRLSQEELAIAVGTAGTAICRLEKGGGKLAHSSRISSIKNIADALGCDFVTLLVPRNRNKDKK